MGALHTFPAEAAVRGSQYPFSYFVGLALSTVADVRLAASRRSHDANLYGPVCLRSSLVIGPCPRFDHTRPPLRARTRRHRRARIPRRTWAPQRHEPPAATTSTVARSAGCRRTHGRPCARAYVCIVYMAAAIEVLWCRWPWIAVLWSTQTCPRHYRTTPWRCIYRDAISAREAHVYFTSPASAMHTRANTAIPPQHHCSLRYSVDPIVQQYMRCRTRRVQCPFSRVRVYSISLGRIGRQDPTATATAARHDAKSVGGLPWQPFCEP